MGHRFAEFATPRDAPALVSVVIPVRNGAATLDAQLTALAQQSYGGDWELVVADNGSTDGTRSLCESWTKRLPSLRVVDASGRAGPSHARNVGASAARGELLAFCDADDEVHPRWLERLVDVARTHDLVGGVQEVAQLNDESVRASRGARNTNALARPLRFLPFAPTNNMAVWADVYSTVGGMDVAYRTGEDIEFSWRAQLGGFTIGYAQEAVVHYRYRTTARGVFRQAFNTGWTSVQLHREFGSHGARQGSAARRWLAMVLRMPMLLFPDKRLASVRLIATNLGSLAASVRLRFGALDA